MWGYRELLERFKGFAGHCGTFLSFVAVPSLPEHVGRTGRASHERIYFRVRRYSAAAKCQRELLFLLSAGRRSAHFRMASKRRTRRLAPWCQTVFNLRRHLRIGRTRNDSGRCQAAELLPQHFLSILGIARSSSEKRNTLPSKRWSTMTISSGLQDASWHPPHQ